MDMKEKEMVEGEELFLFVRELLADGKKARFTVTGRSMLPWIGEGRDQVLLATPKGKRLRKGDIILFQTEGGKHILHRIHRIEEDGFRTIGDGNILEDGLVLPGQVIGVVEKVYRKGRVIECDTFTWRLIFLLWRQLLPIRGILMEGYAALSRLKGTIHF